MSRDDTFVQHIQFGSLWTVTKGVRRIAYEQLYPEPPFHTETNSFEEKLRRMHNCSARTLEGKVCTEEMETRMARSFLASQQQKYARGYENSRGVLKDFAEACAYVDETIFLESDNEGNVQNNAFGFVHIKKNMAVPYLSRQGNSYRVRPEYTMRDNCPSVYIYFPEPEFFLLKETEEKGDEMGQKKADKLAEFCADAGWTLEPLVWERETKKVLLYKVQAAEIEDVPMNFGSGLGYISLAGNIKAMEKAVELWSDLFDKNKAKGEKRGKIELLQQ